MNLINLKRQAQLAFAWRRRSPAPWRRRTPPPPRTAPLRRELYPYSRDSATALLRRATPPLVPTGEHKQGWLGGGEFT